VARFLQADSIVPEPGNPQALNRYAYVRNNPLRHTDPTGHSAEDIGYFLMGVLAQWGYDNAWLLPMQQQALAVKMDEPAAMQAGRHVGNATGAMQGVVEVYGGAEAAVGGIVACGTGLGCLVGAPAAVAGAVVATHGGVVAVTAAAQEVEAVGKLLMAQRTAHGEQRAAQGRPTGTAWNDAQQSTPGKVFLDTETSNYVVQGDKGRIHIFTQEEGILKSHTSFVNPLRNTAERLRLGKWRLLTEDEYKIWLRLRDQALQGGGN